MGRLSAALCVLVAVGTARAEPRTARLSYSRGESAAACPDEREVRNAVAARLGYDPFTPDAKTSVTAILGREGRVLHARIELLDERGQLTGSRTLTSTGTDCSELASAVSLAMSIAIDPLVLARSAPPPKVLSAVCPTCPPPPTPARERTHLRAAAGVLGALGSTPGDAAFGLSVSLGFRYRAFSLDVEGRFDVPSGNATNPPAGARTNLYLAALAACAHYRFLAGCVLAAAGALHGVGTGLSAPLDQTTPFAAAGWRAAVEPHLVRWLSLRVHLDLLATLTRTTLQLNGVTAWTTPPVSGALGVAALASF